MNAADFANDDSRLDTIFALRRTSARALASDCYETANEFVENARFWGKGELAMWLIGPYSRLAQDVRDESPASRPSLRAIDANTITRVIAEAHHEVIAALVRLEDPNTAADLAFEMIGAGFVTTTVDSNGASGWAPTTNARRLADRVVSLFVADFMTRVFAADAFALAA